MQLDPLDRPDLAKIDPDVCVYIRNLDVKIETLETELKDLRSQRQPSARRPTATAQTEAISETPLEPDEPPTTLNLLTLSQCLEKIFCHPSRTLLDNFYINFGCG